jgi:hypothetical protein
VLGQQHPQRPPAGLRLPGGDRGLELGPADARDLAQARARVAVDDLEDLVAVALQQPGGALGPDVLDRLQQREQRVGRGGRADADLLDVQLAAELRMLAPGALDLDGVALVQVGDRAGERQLGAVVTDRREHGEAAVVGPPADRDDLGGQRRGFRHATRVRCEADRPRETADHMGFMDKAKKFAEQAQKEAKDGTLKDRAKALADQAQAKLDEVQGQFNEGQKKSADGQAATPETPATPPAATPAPDPDATAQAAETVAEAAAPPPAPEAAAPAPQPPTPPSGGAADVDRSHEAAPKVTGGDPLAG